MRSYCQYTVILTQISKVCKCYFSRYVHIDDKISIYFAEFYRYVGQSQNSIPSVTLMDLILANDSTRTPRARTSSPPPW